MLQGNRCEICGVVVKGARAANKQTKYCVGCTRQRKGRRSDEVWTSEERREYMREYVSAHRLSKSRSRGKAITPRDMRKGAPISRDEARSPGEARALTIDDIDGEFDSILARMQTDKARKGMNAAFNASSAQLGRAAVKGARKRRKRLLDRSPATHALPEDVQDNLRVRKG